MKEYGSYNRRRKPWRKLSGVGYGKKDLKRCFVKFLCLLLFFEAAILVPPYVQGIYQSAQSFFWVSRDIEAKDKVYKAGETREQGVTVDWRKGTVKLWQRVERVILQDLD